MSYSNLNPHNHNIIDVNYFNSSYSNNYCKSVFHSNHKYFNNFLVVHQNIRSLRKNFDLFVTHLQSFDKQPDMIFLTEIWIYECEIVDFNIPGYMFSANCNDTYSSGGVAVFIKTDYNNFEISNSSLGSADMLKVVCEINYEKYCFICIYRLHVKSKDVFFLKILAIF